MTVPQCIWLTDLLVSLFVYFSRVDTQCYVSFRCVTQQSNFTIHYDVLATSLPTICCHKTLLQYHWLYSLCCTFDSCDLFHYWKPISPTLCHSFCQSCSPSLWHHQLSLFIGLVYFLFVYSFVFLLLLCFASRFHMSEIIWYLFLSVWIT